MTENVLQLAGNVLIHWAALAGAVSVVLHARVPWWRSEMGRHLMAYMLVIDTVLVLSCIRIWTGDSDWFSLLRLVVFIGVPLAMTQRAWIQVKAQRDARRPVEGDPTGGR